MEWHKINNFSSKYIIKKLKGQTTDQEMIFSHVPNRRLTKNFQKS